ncbi:MAG: HAMP domain-containing histidine kinase [Lachnospiraceae bacterium]|nr:HAMP domain-containing histidine kinase [Lachnospiraceae bacterium]
MRKKAKGCKRKNTAGLVLLAFLPLAVAWLFIRVNLHTPVIPVEKGVAEACDKRAEEGPFILTGQWSRFAGSYEPEELLGLTGEEVRDIQYIRRMRGYTYTFVLKVEDVGQWSFLLPRPHSSRLWLNGTEVTGQGEGLSSGELYELRDYTQEKEIRVVLQVTNSSIYDVYQGMILGSRANLSAIQYGWMQLDLIAVGLSVMLILMCMTLFLPKPSETYLLLLALSTLAELAHFLLIPRHPALAFFHLGTTAFYRQLGFINYYVCQQFVPGESRRWMDWAVPAAVISTALGCALWPAYSNDWIQASYLFYMALQAWILGKGVLHRTAEAPVIMAGCMLALGNELFYRMLYAGYIPQGRIDIELMPAQYMRFAYIVAFALATCMKYGKKFCEADSLSVNLEKKVREQTEELRRSNETLVRTQETRQRFMTDMVHNLRSPLFAMGGYLDLLRDEIAQPTKEQEKYLDMLDRKTEYLGKMTDDMFLIYRLEDGQLRLEREPFDLCQLLEMLAQDARARGQEKCVHVEVRTQTKECFVTGDRFRLKQALDNILDNGIRYSPERGTLWLRQGIEGEECFVSVRDEGPGICKEQQERLFERYKSKGAGGKNGLGLSISYHIIQLHKGRLEVKSREGEGTEMTVWLRADSPLENFNGISTE